MDEEARRAIEDSLEGIEGDDHPLFPHIRRTFLSLAGVVDRHRDESNEEHVRTKDRVEQVNKLAIAIGSGVMLALVSAVIGIWFR